MTDLTGQRFGKLVVVGDGGLRQYKLQRYRMWRCRCDCGGEKLVMTGNLRHGYTRSCGCLHAATPKARWHLERPLTERPFKVISRAENSEAWIRKGYSREVVMRTVADIEAMEQRHGVRYDDYSRPLPPEPGPERWPARCPTCGQEVRA